MVLPVGKDEIKLFVGELLNEGLSLSEIQILTKLVNDIKKIIQHLRDRGLGVLITDHNVRETLDVCEKAYIVSHGELIASGTSEEVLSDQRVRDVYLGEQFRL
jgi:ABC-type lipopolysaccharide export system ATPase subunit